MVLYSIDEILIWTNIITMVILLLYEIILLLFMICYFLINRIYFEVNKMKLLWLIEEINDELWDV